MVSYPGLNNVSNSNLVQVSASLKNKTRKILQMNAIDTYVRKNETHVIVSAHVLSHYVDHFKARYWLICYRVQVGSLKNRK